MATIAFNAIRTIWSAGRAVTFLPRQVLLPECAFFLPAIPSPSPSSTSTFSTSSSKRSDNPTKIDNFEDLENLLNIPQNGNRGDEFFNALKREIPEIMTEDFWAEIQSLPTVEDQLWKIKVYRFFHIKERHKLNREGKTLKGDYAEARRRALYAERIGDKDKIPESLYGENGHSLLGPVVSILKFHDEQAVRQVQNTHMMHAINFGQPLVIDLGVDYQMSDYEGRKFLQQMKAMYNVNRSHWEPFNLFLCNYNPSNVLQRELVEEKPSERLWNVTRRCFTNIFPKEKIVYLSSQSRLPLTNFSHDAVYVVGGAVDKRPGKDEMTKIKEMGLNHAYFDLGSCFSKFTRALLDQRDTPNLRHNGHDDFGDRRSPNRLPRPNYYPPLFGRSFTEEELTAVKRDFIQDFIQDLEISA